MNKSLSEICFEYCERFLLVCCEWNFCIPNKKMMTTFYQVSDHIFSESELKIKNAPTRQVLCYETFLTHWLCNFIAVVFGIQSDCTESD